MVRVSFGIACLILVFVVAVHLAYAEEQGDRVIHYRGPEDWYNYEHYKEGDQTTQQRINAHQDLFSQTKLKEFYDDQPRRPIIRFFWKSDIKPRLLRTKHISFKGTSGIAYYYFAGAYWKESKIREIIKDVYSNLPVEGKKTLYQEKDLKKKEKQYSEHKPKRRIFAQIIKRDSVYFLSGKMWQEIKEKKEKKPEEVARDLWLKGRQLMKQGHYAEAIKCFEQAKEKAPKYSPPYYRLGLCYEQIGERQKALEHYEEYLRLIEGKSGKEKIRNKVIQTISRLQSTE